MHQAPNNEQDYIRLKQDYLKQTFVDEKTFVSVSFFHGLIAKSSAYPPQISTTNLPF